MVLARQFRPQTFSQVLGQETIVKTLLGAIKHNRLAHAYLFSGPMGCGKTTLARIFAKALNCQEPTDTGEPCNKCQYCSEITRGQSLDVLEIDGASHRGIDDIRSINETVSFAPSSHYKIYIIDEVHMLTKEAFNALLKTLEEPPEKVKFLFATTEPHKVLPTILSRCQRFNLKRISTATIKTKLGNILNELKTEYEEEALLLIAHLGEGSLRNGESLLDQVMAVLEEKITLQQVTDLLGLIPQKQYFDLDHAGHKGDLSFAFTLSEMIFNEGKDIQHFIDGLIEHVRHHLQFIAVENPSLDDHLTPGIVKKYAENHKLYNKEQCIYLLEYLIEMQSRLRFLRFERITLEAILLQYLRSFKRISIDAIVAKLEELEKKMDSTSAPSPTKTIPPPVNAPSLSEAPNEAASAPKTVTPRKVESASKTEATQKNTVTSKPAPSKEEKRTYDTLTNFAAVELEGVIQNG